jgi:hydroxymethylpyrimidine pyrophosphatase-like HAD family hydrolase
VAVGNSPKPVKDLAAYTTKEAFGAGFVEFAKTLL